MKSNNATEQKIIDSAMRLFKRHGYASTTIDQICETVGIAKNTYYYHFESKDSLLLAYMLQQKTLTEQLLADILISEKNPFEQFWSLQKKRLDVLIGCGVEIIRHLSNMTAVQSILKNQNKSEYLELELKIISVAQTDGSVRNQTNSRSLVATSTLMFIGILSMWSALDGIFDLEQVMRSGFENIFDVRPDLRKGGDLYERIITAVRKREAQKSKKEKTNAR